MDRLLIGLVLGLIVATLLRRGALSAARREAEDSCAGARESQRDREHAVTNERYVRKRLEQTDQKLEDQYRFRDQEQELHLAAERDLRAENDALRAQLRTQPTKVERPPHLRPVPRGDDEGDT